MLCRNNTVFLFFLVLHVGLNWKWWRPGKGGRNKERQMEREREGERGRERKGEMGKVIAGMNVGEGCRRLSFLWKREEVRRI